MGRVFCVRMGRLVVVLLYFAIISIALVSPLRSFLLFAPGESTKLLGNGGDPRRYGRAFREAGVSHSLVGLFIAYIFIFERFLKDTFPSQFNVFILLVQLGMSISLHLLLAKFRSYLDL